MEFLDETRTKLKSWEARRHRRSLYLSPMDTVGPRDTGKFSLESSECGGRLIPAPEDTTRSDLS